MHPEALKTGRENIRVFSQIESDLLNGMRPSFDRFARHRRGREEVLWNQAGGSTPAPIPCAVRATSRGTSGRIRMPDIQSRPAPMTGGCGRSESVNLSCLNGS
jgi:hypothetical protein